MKKISMKVDGMHCGGCSGRLKRTLEALPQVESCEANHETKDVVVTLKEDLSVEAITKVLSDGGFTVLSVD